jgi:hypothetical protein
MTKYVRHALTAGLLVLGLTSSAAMAQPAIEVPTVPPGLEVPVGHVPFLKGFAVGTQNYVCLPKGASFAWTFLGPQATVFQTFKGDLRQQVTTHYLSRNPVDGNNRPTWQHSFDSSRVWGRVVTSSTDAAFVEPGAIAWLLVEAAGVETGPTSGIQLAQTTYIHRVNTSGGVAPGTGCSEAGNVGAVALVNYTTDYIFYRLSREK